MTLWVQLRFGEDYILRCSPSVGRRWIFSKVAGVSQLCDIIFVNTTILKN